MLLVAICLVALFGSFSSPRGVVLAQAGGECVEFPLSAQEAADAFGGTPDRWTVIANSPSTGYAWRQENLTVPMTVTVPGPGLNGNNWRYDSDQGTFYGPAIVTNTVVGALWQDGFPVICREVEVDGPAELDPEEVGTYTAVFSPTNPTSPVTYTWDTVGGSATITPDGETAEISWEGPGTFSVTVEAQYNNIVLDAVFSVEVVGDPYQYPACVEFPLTPSQAILSFGKDTGLVDWTLLEYGPGYAWSFASPNDPEFINVPAGYHFDWDGGPPVVGPGTVSGAQYGAMWQDEIGLACREVSIEGDFSVMTDTVNVYTAVISPTSPTIPTTYTWTFEGDPVVVENGNMVTVSWPVSGTFEVEVGVAYNNINLAASAVVTVTGDPGNPPPPPPVTYTLYLPAVTKALPPAPPYVPAPLSQALCNTYDPVVLFGVAQWERIDAPANPNDGCGWRLVNYEDLMNLTIQAGSRADHSGGPTTGPAQLLNWTGALSIWVTNP